MFSALAGLSILGSIIFTVWWKMFVYFFFVHPLIKVSPFSHSSAFLFEFILVYWVGSTAFHHACADAKKSIVEMMINSARSLKFDFKAKDGLGQTGYHIAKSYANRTAMPPMLVTIPLPIGSR